MKKCLKNQGNQGDLEKTGKIKEISLKSRRVGASDIIFINYTHYPGGNFSWDGYPLGQLLLCQLPPRTVTQMRHLPL